MTSKYLHLHQGARTEPWCLSSQHGYHERDLEISDDLTRYRIFNYIYGYTYDATSEDDSNPLAKREWLLGDIIHSEPRIIDYLDSSWRLDLSVYCRGRQRRHAPCVYRFDCHPRGQLTMRQETRSLPLFPRISCADFRSSAIDKHIVHGGRLPRSLPIQHHERRHELRHDARLRRTLGRQELLGP